MRFVKVSKNEMERTLALYNNVMSHACHGLFFREGQIIGEEISKLAISEGERFFTVVEKLLVGRGWVEEIRFDKRSATARGSIEAAIASPQGCHRLRGIVKAVYEAKEGRHLTVVETECAGNGSDKCVFTLEGFGDVL